MDVYLIKHITEIYWNVGVGIIDILQEQTL